MRYVETLEQAGVEFVELRGDAPNRLLIVSDPHNKPAARFTLWAESIWELPGGSYLKHGGAVYWMTDYSAAHPSEFKCDTLADMDIRANRRSARIRRLFDAIDAGRRTGKAYRTLYGQVEAVNGPEVTVAIFARVR